MISLPPESLYEIRDPRNFYSGMRDDVVLLRNHKKYLSLTTVILCCMEALAAQKKLKKNEKTDIFFDRFVKTHMPTLDSELGALCPGKAGSHTLYHHFRNGFAHERGPHRRFVIAEDHEVRGAWAEKVEIRGAVAVALNVDRLTREFLVILDKIERESST